MTTVNMVSSLVMHGLRFTASWPGTPFPILHRLCWMIVVGVLQTYQYSYVILHSKYDTLMEVIDNLSICMPFTLGHVKLLIIWVYHGVFRDILRIINEESQKYATLDAWNLIPKTVYLCERLTKTVIGVTVSSTIFYAIAVFVFQDSNANEQRDLLLKMDLPFDTNASPNYELAIILQYIYQASAAFVYSLSTAVLLTMVLHVGCQVDVMCRTLVEDTSEKKKQLKFFISRHREIIFLTQRIEKLFRYIALSQLLSNTLLTCCLGYLIITALDTDNGYVMLVKCVVFYAAICLDIFVYCFVGEYLRSKSNLVGDTAYRFLWYDLHQSDVRLIILVILRSQRGFPFTFGKFANASLQSFTDIMKASASYMSVLLAMS